LCLIIYSVAVINLPINTIKTAGIAIPINGTKIGGKRLDKSDGMVFLTSLNTLVFILEKVVILLLDDIKIINFLHVKFFRNCIIILIGIFLLVLKKRSFNQLINKRNLYSIKLKKIEKRIINFYLIKIIFYTITKKKSTKYFIKILKEIKFLVFFKVIQKIN
tara:strand:+ start:58 stop:543 length:486 start_codon:yes stop_codon:yes gene_type:complete